MTTIVYNNSGTATSTAIYMPWYGSGTSATATTSTITTTSNQITGTSIGTWVNAGATMVAGDLEIYPGQAVSIKLPDGARIEVKADGSYQMFDTDAKVTYKANKTLEFNKYINGSDLLEEFIKYVAKLGRVSKKEFFDLPVELFIQWLVIRAAEADGEVADYSPVEKALPLALPNFKKRHAIKCKCCGKFITKRELEFCNYVHMAAYAEKRNVFKDTL